MTIHKQIMKYMVPNLIWNWLRRIKIIWKHGQCQQELNEIFKTVDDRLLSEIKPLKQLPDSKKIIWQYWAQGFDSSSMPYLVNMCFQSVNEHTSNFLLIRISDENIKEYIEIPRWLAEKRCHISKAHFADLLRCVLLSKYGGLWLDATTFLTGNVPSYIYDTDFFMYQRDNAEENKKYWKKTFAYYWGWSPRFMVRTLIGIIYAEKGNKTISDMAVLLLTFWKSRNSVPDYFFFQILIEMYFKKNPEARPTVVNDTVPHLLRQYINGCPVPGLSLADIFNRTTIHSLNYKNEAALSRLSAIFPEYKDVKHIISAK